MSSMAYGAAWLTLTQDTNWSGQRILWSQGASRIPAVAIYQLYLAIEDIDHSKTKAYSPQTNGICERFHKTVKEEFYSVAFRKKVYRTIEELQTDLDVWINEYNIKRTHSGKYCFGRTPMQTFLESVPLAKEKLIEYYRDSIFSANSSFTNPQEDWQKKKPSELDAQGTVTELSWQVIFCALSD